MEKESSDLNKLITPSFIISQPKLIRNCKKIIDLCDQYSISLRPHIKTHKTIKGALCQLFGEAMDTGKREKKITVSTLNEALFYAENGFQDILYAVPLSPNKFDKANKLNQMIPKFSIVVDSIDIFEMLLKYSSNQKEDVVWSVYVVVDSGYHRDGIDTKYVKQLILKILEHKQFKFLGLYTHAGNSYGSTDIKSISKQEIEELLKLVENEKDYQCPIIAFGSTPTISNLAQDKDIYKRYKYEMHPGNYIFYDVSQMNMNSCAQEDIACFVLASVIGIYKERNRILIDAGALALSKDSGIHYGGQHSAYGLIVGHENLQLVSLSQEVGIIEAKEGHSIDFGQFYIGKLLRIFPNHSCLTAAHYDRFVVIDEQENIIDHWDTCKREW